MENENRTPDVFDRMLGAVHGLPDVCSTKPSTVRAVTPLVGASQLFIIQTYRQREVGDTIFIEYVNEGKTVRIAIPPTVADAIARQRAALAARSRSKAAKAVVVS